MNELAFLIWVGTDWSGWLDSSADRRVRDICLAIPVLAEQLHLAGLPRPLRPAKVPTDGLISETRIHDPASTALG